jgi:hypothetical protein
MVLVPVGVKVTPANVYLGFDERHPRIRGQ